MADIAKKTPEKLVKWVGFDNTSSSYNPQILDQFGLKSLIFGKAHPAGRLPLEVKQRKRWSEALAGWSEAARLLKMLRGRHRRGRPEWIRGQWSVTAFDTEDEYDDDDYWTNHRSGNGESLRPSERERHRRRAPTPCR